MAKHYHVVENECGYLPESDPFVTTRKDAARSFAAALARDLRDLGYTVSGNREEGYIAYKGSSDRVIEIHECEEEREDCHA